MAEYRSISIEELVKRCVAQRDFHAWQEFIRRFHRLIASVALRASARYGNASTEVIDELIQDTYLKLCADDFRVLRTFSPESPDSFVGYIRVITANIVRDHFKFSSALKRGVGRVHETVDCVAGIPSGDSEGSQVAIEQSILLQEIQKHLNDCSEGPDQDRNRTVFWLYYRVGLSAAAIAALPELGLSTKGVESLLLRTTRELRKRIAPARSVSDECLDHVK